MQAGLGTTARAALHYRIDGSGPPIVLLHPIGLDLTAFDPLAGRLARRHTVVRVDLRGHGSSPDLPAAYALADHAADVHELLQRLKLGSAAVAGFSFGGMIAQIVAATYPSDVSALIAAACPSTLPDAARPIMVERGARAERDGMPAIVDETLDRWFTDGFRGRAEVNRTRDRLLADTPANWASAWRAIAALDTMALLPAIRVPTLCLAGALDQASPPATLEAIARGIPAARVQVIPDGSHMFFIEQPGPTAEAIADFLSDTGVI